MTCGIILDGYNEDGFIKEVPGLYPSLRFTFRPFLIEELIQYRLEATRLDNWPLRQYSAKRLAERLIDWDLRDHKKQLVPINDTNLLRVKELLYGRIFDIVTGQLPSDIPNDADAKAIAEQAAAAVQATQESKAYREVIEERDAKNL